MPSLKSRSRRSSVSRPCSTHSEPQSPRPLKRSKTTHSPSALLALDSDEEVAALLEEEAAQLRAAIEVSLEDQKKPRRLWSPVLDDETLVSFALAASSSRSSCSASSPVASGSTSFSRTYVDLTLDDKDTIVASQSQQGDSKGKRRAYNAEIDPVERNNRAPRSTIGDPDAGSHLPVEPLVGDSDIFDEPSWVCAGGQYIAPKWIRADLFDMENVSESV